MNDTELMPEVEQLCNRYSIHPHSTEADDYLSKLRKENITSSLEDYRCPHCKDWLHPIDYYCFNERCSGN